MNRTSKPRVLERVTGIFGIAGVLILTIVTTAGATIRGPQTLTVSCDGWSIATGVRVVFGSNGTYKITQNSTNPTSQSVTWAVSDNGNSLGTQIVSNGGTVSWSSVLKSGYTTKVYRNGAANCNGIGFGHGNYAWDYTVTYPG